MAWKKRNITGRISLGLFLSIEAALYLGFLWIDSMGGSTYLSTTLKFFGIVLCFLYALFGLLGNCGFFRGLATQTFNVSVHRDYFHLRELFFERDSVLVTVALFFTVCADICLLLTSHYTLGLLFFSVVQCIYLYRIHCFGNTSWNKHIIQRGGVIVLAVAFVIIGRVEWDLLLCITVFYFVNISFNVWDALWVKRTGGKKNFMWSCYAVGMVLFLLCDINVGIFNMSSYLDLDNSIYHMIYNVSAVAMWFFYLPAQVLITLSGGAKSYRV